MEHHDAHGRAIGERRGRVFYIQICGIATKAIGTALCAEADRTIGDGDVVDFMNDWSEMVSFDTEWRKAMVNWGMTHPKKVRSFFILLKSAMVSVGVNISAIPLRAVGVKLTTTSDRKVFEEKLREAMDACAEPVASGAGG